MKLRQAHREAIRIGVVQPFWYGYSVGRWEGDTLVVETNNLRGAETGPYDGWLDVRGSPYTEQAKFVERIRRPTYGKFEIDVTLDDPKAYTKPFTVRVNQQISPDDEIIEFICVENQQFRRRVRIDRGSNPFGDALTDRRESLCRPRYGLMFWFNRNRFVGSYLRLIWTRRP